MVFIGACLLLVIAPGPDLIFLTATSIGQGRRAGVATAGGLSTGCLVHTCAASLGISAVLATSAWAFSAVKAAGAVYLLYLAWQTYRHRDTFLDFSQKAGSGSARALYLRGLVMNVLNPKVALFFLAFLPQFADPKIGAVWKQMLFLGGIFSLLTWLILSLVGLCAGQVGGWLSRAAAGRGSRLMAYGVSVVFVGLALRLLAEER